MCQCSPKFISPCRAVLRRWPMCAPKRMRPDTPPTVSLRRCSPSGRSPPTVSLAGRSVCLGRRRRPGLGIELGLRKCRGLCSKPVSQACLQSSWCAHSWRCIGGAQWSCAMESTVFVQFSFIHLHICLGNRRKPHQEPAAVAQSTGASHVGRFCSAAGLGLELLQPAFRRAQGPPSEHGTTR